MRAKLQAQRAIAAVCILRTVHLAITSSSKGGRMMGQREGGYDLRCIRVTAHDAEKRCDRKNPGCQSLEDPYWYQDPNVPLYTAMF